MWKEDWTEHFRAVSVSLAHGFASQTFFILNAPPVGWSAILTHFCMTQHFIMEVSIFVQLNIFQIKIPFPDLYFFNVSDIFINIQCPSFSNLAQDMGL